MTSPDFRFASDCKGFRISLFLGYKFFMSLKAPLPQAPPEKPAKKAAPKAKAGTYRFLGKNRSLLAICLILAVAIHVLVLLGFGTYTLFKGSVPRMPFTSEGGVPSEDVGLEAPPTEEMLEKLEETMEPEAAAMPTETPTDDTVLATAGLTSTLPVASAPPTLNPAALPTATATGSEKLMAKPSARPGAKASAVNFFGVKGEGTNVYFVVDVSDSMLESDRGGVPGFAVVKSNLRQMIQSLDEATCFNVVTFGANGADLFKGASVPATAEEKKAAQSFLNRYNLNTQSRGTKENNYRPKITEFGLIQVDKGTDRITTRLDLGLLAAFEGLADTIFLISDGKPPVLAVDRRAEAREAMKEAEIPEADRAKYQKEISDWRREYEKYAEEMKTYREKYKDLLAKQAQKIAEVKARGAGKVKEGSEVDYGVKIPGLPPPPKEPKQPKPPEAKLAGKTVSAAGDIYDEASLIRRIKEVCAATYNQAGAPAPSIHTVGYMSKNAEVKFLQALASRNNGTFMRISAPIKETSGN
ncbi:VWA domain-containing protein [bacterium]|nr:VWA domain-containing protein [bacterium]